MPLRTREASLTSDRNEASACGDSRNARMKSGRSCCPVGAISSCLSATISHTVSGSPPACLNSSSRAWSRTPPGLAMSWVAACRIGYRPFWLCSSSLVKAPAILRTRAGLTPMSICSWWPKSAFMACTVARMSAVLP